MKSRPTILIVDDEPTNIEILSAALDEDYEIYFATSGPDALDVMQSVLPDMILLDVLMPGMDGYEVCRRLKEDDLLRDVPVVFTTALDEEHAQLKGLDLGAIDYITKPISAPIVRARIRNHIEAKTLRDSLAEIAVTDTLTGLGNRRMLDTTLRRETLRLARKGEPLSVIILDVDFFKRFNDSYGHSAGDRCLTMIAAALKRAVRRAADLAARHGGEEFACVLPENDHETAMEIARGIRERVQMLGIPHNASDVAPYVTVSIGVATAHTVPGAVPEVWMEVADEQLYIAKTSGRNKAEGTVFDPVERMSRMVQGEPATP